MDSDAIMDKEWQAEFKAKHFPPKSDDGSSTGPRAPALAGDPKRPSPRYVKCHFPFSMNNPRLLDVCKVVYVARNPKDVCVSWYHHMRLLRMRDFLGDLEVSIGGGVLEDIAVRF